MHKNNRHIFAALLASVFIFVTLATLFFCVQILHDTMSPSLMDAPQRMNTVGMSQSSCSISQTVSCIMSIGQHIERWQQLFVTGLIISLSALLVVLSVILVLSIFRRFFLHISLYLYNLHKRYYREHFGFRLYMLFPKLFSEGIVQPKLCA